MTGRIKRYLLVIGFFFLFISTARAADLNKQRQCFLDAEDAFKKGNQEKFNTLLTRIKDYPLYPYLFFFKSERHTYRQGKGDLSFLSEYESSPLSVRLRQAGSNTSRAKSVQRWRVIFGNLLPVLQYGYVRALLELARLISLVQAEKLWLRREFIPENTIIFLTFFTHRES
jgi:hypothetical protein